MSRRKKIEKTDCTLHFHLKLGYLLLALLRNFMRIVYDKLKMNKKRNGLSHFFLSHFLECFRWTKQHVTKEVKCLQPPCFIFFFYLQLAMMASTLSKSIFSVMFLVFTISSWLAMKTDPLPRSFQLYWAIHFCRSGL